MPQPLRLLIVEDSDDDARLIVHALDRSDYAVSWRRVDTAEALGSALDGQAWDVVVSDHAMPHFSATEALALVRNRRPDLPVIIVSGAIDLNAAVVLIKKGAQDYFSKDELVRLAPAVERELREAGQRQQRRTAEARQRETDARLQSMFTQSSVGVLVVDLHGRILEANPAFESMLGRTAAALREMNVLDLTAEEDRPQQQDLLSRISRDEAGEGLAYEKRYLRSDGQPLWVRVTANALRTEAGQPFALIGIVEDITARRQAEDALRENETRYRMLTELVSDFVTSTRFGPDGQITETWFTDSFERATGYEPAEIVALGGWLKVIHPDDVAVAREQSRQALRGRASVEAFRICAKSGEVLWLSSYVRPEWDPSGRYIARVLTAAQDITARKQAEAALQHSEARYKTILDNAALGIFESTPGGQLTRVNPAYARMFGYGSPDEAVQQITNVAQQIYVHPERRPEIVRVVTERGGVGFFDVEYRRRDGSTFVGALTLQAAEDADGQLTQLFGYVQDITERKVAEQALRDSEARYRAVAEENARLLAQARRDADTTTRLLQEVNHRVKNNLAAIIGLLYTHQRRMPQTQEAVRTLVDETVNQITGLAKVHDMLSATAWSPLPLDDLCRQIVSTALRASPNGPPATVHVSPSPVKVSPRQANGLALILNELTTNTLKHGLEGQRPPHISVEISQEEGMIVLAYSNDGPGYPDDVLRGERPTTGLDLIRSLAANDLSGTAELLNTPHPLARLRFKALPAS